MSFFNVCEFLELVVSTFFGTFRGIPNWSVVGWLVGWLLVGGWLVVGCLLVGVWLLVGCWLVGWLVGC